MKLDFAKVIQEINYNYKDLIHIEFEKNSWVRFRIRDRFFLIKEKYNIENIFEQCGFFKKYELSTGWFWDQCQYEEYEFNNPYIVYKYFLSSENYENTLQISDTTDPIHDICLFKLRDAINEKYSKNKRSFKQCPLFYSYSRSINYYEITFYTLTQAQAFNSLNLFNRILSWSISELDKQKIYVCHMYYNDKEDVCPNISLESLIKTTKVPLIKKPKQLSKKGLFEKVKSGEITYEEFEKILQKD